jgi:cytochrome c oxidase subunit II
VPLVLAIFLCLLSVVTVLVFVRRVWWAPGLASMHGASIDDQLVLALIVAGTIFVLAHFALGYFIWRYRASGRERALYWCEHPKLEAAWTIATALLFIGLGIEGNRVWAGYVRESMPSDVVRIEVTAQQFAWNFRYPGADGRFGRTDPKLIDDSLGNYIGIDPNDSAGQDDIVTQNLAAIPVNRAVQIMLRTKDVTHSFFVPQFRVKQDAVPGLSIPVHFTARATGEYEIACAELCGLQHHKMRGRLHSMNDAEFQGWLRSRAAI